MIRITEVQIYRLEQAETDLKAYANITIDDCFVVHGIRVLEGPRGLFIGMPRRRRPNGKPQDIAHPVTNETRRLIEQRVLEAYHQSLEQKNST